jgi:hypothetical protein
MARLVTMGHFYSRWPVQVIVSNYSTRSVGHHYPPKVHEADHKDFSLIVQYTDRFYAQRHGTLYRVSPQALVPALDASSKTGARV